MHGNRIDKAIPNEQVPRTRLFIRVVESVGGERLRIPVNARIHLVVNCPTVVVVVLC